MSDHRLSCQKQQGITAVVLGGCGSNIGNPVPFYRNVTTTASYVDGNPVEPYAIPNSPDNKPDCGPTPDPCGDVGQPPCGPLQYYLQNVYIEDGEITQSCLQRGFKNVQSWKCHHGRLPFDAPEHAGWDESYKDGDCAVRHYRPLASQTRYLTMAGHTTRHYTEINPTYGDLEKSADVSKIVNVDRYSGNVTYTSSVTGTDQEIIDYASQLNDELPTTKAALGALYFSKVQTVVEQALSQPDEIRSNDRTWHHHIWKDDSYWVETDPETGAGYQVYDALSDDLEVNLNTGFLRWTTYANGIKVFEESIQITPYQVVHNWYDHIENPSAQPPITTTTVTVTTHTLANPYTSTQNEDDCKRLLGEWPMNDDVLYPWRNDGYATVGPMVHYDESIVPIEPDVGMTASIFYGSGYIIGKPNGKDTGSFDSHFDSRHENWLTCDSMWFVRDYGSWSGKGTAFSSEFDAFVPKAATRWTNAFEAKELHPYAFNEYKAGVRWMQKWAQKISNRPSHNFAEPCGVTRYAVQQNAIGCVTDFTGNSITLNETDTTKSIVTGDKVIITDSTNDMDGGYTVTRISDYGYTLSAREWLWPTGSSTYKPAYGTTAMSKLRFITAPGICGDYNISSVTAVTPVTCSFSKQHYMRDGEAIFIKGVEGATGVNGHYIVTVINETTIALRDTVGSGVYTGGGIAQISFAAPEYWNDTQPKGTFVALTWTHDQRENQELQLQIDQEINQPTCIRCQTNATLKRQPQTIQGMPDTVIEQTIVESCLPVTTCCPAMVIISPNVGDRNCNAYHIPWKSMKADYLYGTLWQAQPVGDMADPLWQDIPGTICGNSYTEDDGTCIAYVEGTAYYAHRPLVEAWNTPPAGAPPMPLDAVVGFATLADFASATPITKKNIVTPPAVVGNNESLPNKTVGEWTIFNNQLFCCETDGTFKTQYEASGITCTEEDI